MSLTRLFGYCRNPKFPVFLYLRILTGESIPGGLVLSGQLSHGSSEGRRGALRDCPAQLIASSNEVTQNSSYCWECTKTGLDSGFELL